MHQAARRERQPATPLWQRTWWGTLTVGLYKRQAIAGGIFTVLLSALVLAHTSTFLDKETPCGVLLYVLTLLACLILGGLTVLRWQMPGRPGNVLSIVIYCLLPIVSMTMVECLNGVFTWDWAPYVLLLNYVVYFLFYGLIYLFSGSLRLSMLVINPFFFLLGIINFYVKLHRGTPFLPLDIFNARTAANVAGSYSYAFNYQVIIAIVLLVFLQIAAFKMRTPKMETVTKIATRVFFGTLITCVLGLYLFTDVYAKVGLKPDFWNQSRGYRNTGVVYNFFLNTKYLHFSAPENYDPDAIEEVMYTVLEQDKAINVSESTSATPPPKTPNIICIMNESLADLSVLGEVHTNVDYMPYLRSLTENTVRGNLYVPVIGSGTSNTEFEFLTGLSTSFFPAGSNAYMLYVKEPTPSLVSTLSDQGYSRRAFHPYYASGWNRVNVYNNFGFQRFSSITSVIDSSILNEYQENGLDGNLLEQLVEAAYPGENVLVRRYVSDSYNYKKLIDMYETRDTAQPFFLFNVTMQNHGGYREVSTNFREDVFVTDEFGQPLTKVNADGETVAMYPKVNQYLSLMKRSDAAFKELIDYFSAQEEPTVICMFGDHQPNVESGYIAQLLGANSVYTLNTQQTQQRYITPFYIWANFPIEEKTVDKLSVNYLSSYVLDVAGVEMPVFNQYLLALSRRLPVINTVGYIDAQDNYFTNDEKSAYSDLLAGYENVAYNMLFDTENRKNALFMLP